MRRRFYNFEPKPYHLNAKFTGVIESPSQMTELWQKLCLKISRHLRLGLKAHAFVLMHNHFHLLASFPEKEPEALRRIAYLLLLESFQVQSSQAPPPDPMDIDVRQIDNFRHYTEAYRYVYRNPVDAGLVLRVEDYPYSSLHKILGFSREPESLFLDNMGLIFHPLALLNWLNGEQEHLLPLMGRSQAQAQ